jgi:hypothetical protein
LILLGVRRTFGRRGRPRGARSNQVVLVLTGPAFGVLLGFRLRK